MIVFPNAKINIGLNVVRKRPDGYHDIETVFYPVNICDAIEFTPTDNVFTFNCRPNVTTNDSDNLILKAINMLRQEYAIPGLHADAIKQIPAGAGLGGGSADAAFTLKALNTLFNLGMTDEELEAKAAALGADCPFFIKNRPVLATGTGNIFTPVELPLHGYAIVVVNPGLFVSTKEAFSRTRPKQPATPLKEAITMPVENWKDVIVNDFEECVFALHPEVGQIKSKLYGLGAQYASMTGTGSSVYGLFKRIPPALHESFRGCRVWTSQA